MGAGLREDLRFALRIFRKQPGSAFAAVVALALGIGFTTAVYSSADVLVFRPLPIPGIDNTVFLFSHLKDTSQQRWSTSPAEFSRWKSSLQSLQSIFAAGSTRASLTGSGDPVSVEGKLVTDGFFPTVQLQPLLGRAFLAEEFKPGKDGVVILSHALWDRQFGRDPTIVGREIKLDGRAHQVVGVMPQYFQFPVPAEFWKPLALTSEELAVAGNSYLTVHARLKPATTLNELQAELPVVMAALQREHPGIYDRLAHSAEPLSNSVSGNLTHDYMLVVLACSGFLLLIACVNVANLQLARLLSRTRELSIRSALGAGRWRLVRQIIVEASMLSLAGMLLGLIVANWSIDLIKAGMPPEVMRFLPGWQRMGINGDVLAWAIFATMGAALVSSLAPTFWMTGQESGTGLRDSSRGSTTGHSRPRLSAFLVTSEIVLSMVLLVGAVLMARTLGSIAKLPDGVRPHELLTFRVSLPDTRYPNAPDVRRFQSQLVDRLRALPGVTEAGFVHNLPFSGSSNSYGVAMEGRDYGRGPKPNAIHQPASAGFIEAFGLRLRQGRGLQQSDGESTQQVAVINQAFASQIAKDDNPIGRRFKFDGHTVTIVGVVENTTHDFVERAPRPAMFLPGAQFPERSTDFFLRTHGDPASLIPAVRGAVRQLDGAQPIFQPRTMEKMISDSVLGIAYVAAMLSVLGFVALFLSSVGVYCMMAWSVGDRTREIGVRLAMGAMPGSVTMLLLRRGALYAAAGLTIGLVLSAGLARMLSGLIFGISPTDPAALAGVPAILLLMVAIASIVPARRVLRTDPLKALHHE